MKKLALLLGVLLAAAWAIPAAGGPSIAVVDKRERQHFKALDKRIKAATKLAESAQSAKLANTIVRAPMSTQQGGTYSGAVSCEQGWTLTGGGVNWALPFVDYRVISSAPGTSGESWTAQASFGSSPPPASFPTVYAVCTKIK
jgi:hypothetical protein